MAKPSIQEVSVKKVVLTLALMSGVASGVLHFISLGESRTQDKITQETVSLWLSLLLIALVVCYVLFAIVGQVASRKKQ